MAADTAQKRLAVIRFGQPWTGPGYPSAASAIQRAVNLHMYLAGTAPVLVPDVDDPGTTQAAATAAIEGVGLVVAVVTAYSATVPAGEVISQDPAAGSSVAPGSTVTITVSLGPEPVEANEGGGGPDPRKRYEWELFQARLFMRRQQEKLDAQKQDLKQEISEVKPDIQDVVVIAEKTEERIADLRHLEQLVKAYADPPQMLASKSRKAYIQARSQADDAAYENLLRELEIQQREEEEFLDMAARVIFRLH